MQFSTFSIRSFTKTRLVIALALMAAVSVLPAHAQNLVKDGDFEAASPGQVNQTAIFTPLSPFDSYWDVAGNVGIDLNNLYVDSGNRSLWLNAGPGEGGITQNIATKLGQTYLLSFDAGADFSANALTVTFGQDVLTPIVVPNHGFHGPPPGNAGSFTFYSFNVTGAGDFTALTFSSPTSNNPNTLELDNISVAGVPGATIPVAAVPEASSVITLGLLLTLGGALIAAKKKVLNGK